jgi:hypothetical protein
MQDAMPPKKSIIPKPRRLKLPPVRVTEEEFEVIMAKASKVAGGNLSAWIRHAALNHKPNG